MSIHGSSQPFHTNARTLVYDKPTNFIVKRIFEKLVSSFEALIFYKMKHFNRHI